MASLAYHDARSLCRLIAQTFSSTTRLIGCHHHLAGSSWLWHRRLWRMRRTRGSMQLHRNSLNSLSAASLTHLAARRGAGIEQRHVIGVAASSTNKCGCVNVATSMAWRQTNIWRRMRRGSNYDHQHRRVITGVSSFINIVTITSALARTPACAA